MGRLLGLDVGQSEQDWPRRMNLLICSPLRTVETDQLVSQLMDLHREQPIEAYVIGKPNLIVANQPTALHTLHKSFNDWASRFPTFPCTWWMKETPPMKHLKFREWAA